MAVVAIKNLSKLNIKLDLGKNEHGKSIIKSKTFSNVNNAVSNEDLMQVAKLLISLQEHSMNDVIRIDSTTLGE